jgi:hypothetical protein
MSSLKLAFYPTVAMFIFLAVFVAVLWRVCRTPAVEASRHASIPLDDEPGSSSSAH